MNNFNAKLKPFAFLPSLLLRHFLDLSLMKSIRYLIFIFLFLSSIYASAAIPPKYGGILKFAIFDDSFSLDPIKIFTTTERFMAGNIFDGLVRYKDNKIFPGVASSWTISEDGKIWDFHISESAKFHNGRKVTSQDVKYSWQRSIKHAGDDELLQSPLKMISGSGRYRAGKSSEVTGIQIIDQNNLRVILDQPDGSFLSRLASPLTWIIPRGSDDKADFSTRPIGSGPFKIATPKQSLENQVLYIEAFREYAYGRPYLDGIAFIYFADFNSAMLQFEIAEGDVDCLEIPSIEFRRQSHVSAKIKTFVNNRTVYLKVGTGHPLSLTGKENIASIINYGVDTKSILSMLYNQGRSIVHDYQPERAKKIVGDRQIDLGKLIFIKYSSDLTQIARRIELDLSKIGIKITCHPLTRQEYRKSLNDGNYTLALQIFPSENENAIKSASFIPLFYLHTNILLRSNLHGSIDTAPGDIIRLDNVFFLV